MRRPILKLLAILLIVSLAAPSGAVFAYQEPLTELPLTSDDDEGGASQVSEEEDTEPDESKSIILPQTTLNIEEMEMESHVGAMDTQAVDPLIVTEPPIILPLSPLLITAYKSSGPHVHVIQLYNNSSAMVSLDGVSLICVVDDNEFEVTLPSGWIEPRSYVVLAWQGESDLADIEFQFDALEDGMIESIELHHDGHQPLIVEVPKSYTGELLHRFKSAAGNYTTNTTFSVGEETVYGGGLYILPGAPDITVLEVLVNPRSCIYGFETPDCYDFIKLRNDGVTPINLELYRLRSGYSNTNSTASNTAYLGGVIEPGETRTYTHDKAGKRVSFTANDGTVWLEDLYGFISYDLGVPPYIDSDLTAQVGRSWAFNETTGGWQWATPAPFQNENDFTPVLTPGKGGVTTPRELVPCRENQYRSEETNRCRNIASSSTLKPCREGQYRSEETNRCRSIAAAVASVLKPCADDQFRNPATNRCKKIASADDIALADCGEGRERNPATNRCRNVLGASTLAGNLPFPVEDTSSGSRIFTGWWTVIVIGAIGATYGLWEWRFEIRQLGRRVAQFIARLK